MDIDRLIALAPTDLSAARDLLAHARRTSDAALFARTLLPHWAALSAEISAQHGIPLADLWRETLIGLGHTAEEIDRKTQHLARCSTGTAGSEVAWALSLPIPLPQPHLHWLRWEVRSLKESHPDLYAEQLRRDRAAVAPGANLSNANLRNANLSGVDLTGANLSDADLTHANLSNANLRNANLTGANLTGANLIGVDLHGANLRNANLTDADLTGADLTDANLRNANLTGANLTGANIEDTNLTGLHHWMVCHDCYPRHSPATRWPEGWVPLTKAQL